MALVNTLKAKLKAGKAVEGTWINIRGFKRIVNEMDCGLTRSTWFGWLGCLPRFGSALLGMRYVEFSVSGRLVRFVVCLFYRLFGLGPISLLDSGLWTSASSLESPDNEPFLRLPDGRQPHPRSPASPPPPSPSTGP